MHDLQLLENKAKALSLTHYRPGDKVRLKIGGPSMLVLTYTAAPSEQRVVCIWFKSDGSLCEAAFPESVLEDQEPLSLFSDPSNN
jgi:uncharacterized protein YodC (DUF2158 family)